jgi:ArsR family transcriptional regulator
MHTINVKPQDIFQALADPIRIRIIRLLAQTGEETCLCELVDSLLEPQYKLSRHVKILRQAGLLSAEKEGRWIYHRLVRGVD